MERPLVPNEEKIDLVTFVIKGRAEGLRLDSYLGKRFEEYSRSYLQKLITNGKVLVDGKVPKPSAKIREGQTVSIQLPKLEPVYLKPESIPLKIIYEDEYLAILNKQADLVIHPSRGHLGGTLVNALLSYFDTLSDYNDDVYRPGIVHRLDRYTSGVLLVAKNNQAHAALSAQFENREIKKEYLALVEGEMRFEENTVCLPLAVDPKNRERMAVRHAGKEAVTHYQVIKRYPGFTMVHVFPKTGRTHQIRVHLKSEGYPIVADELYGANPELTMERLINGTKKDAELKILNEIKLDNNNCLMNRPALHAWRLTFCHPYTKQEMTHVASLPEDYAHTLNVFQKVWYCPKVAEILTS